MAASHSETNNAHVIFSPNRFCSQSVVWTERKMRTGYSRYEDAKMYNE